MSEENVKLAREVIDAIKIQDASREDIADPLEFIYAEVDDTISVGVMVLLVGRVHYRGEASGADTKSPEQALAGAGLGE